MNKKLFGSLALIGALLFLFYFEESSVVKVINTHAIQSSSVKHQSALAKAHVNKVEPADQQTSNECEKNRVEQDLALLVKDFALELQTSKATGSNLSMTKVYEALIGRHVYAPVADELPDKVYKQFAFEFNDPLVLDKKFLTRITNKEFDLALEHLTTLSQDKRVNYIALALGRGLSIDLNYVYELNSLSDRVTINDAISVTSHVFEQKTLTQILNRTEFDVNGIWYDRDKLMSMLLLAIQSNNDIAVHYWLQRGASTKIYGINLKPLLRLKRPNDEQEYKLATKIVILMANHVDAITGDEYRALQTWLDADTLKLVKALVPESELSLPQALAEVRAHPLVYELNKNLQLLAEQNIDCFVNYYIVSEKNEMLDTLFMDDKKALGQSLNKNMQVNEELKVHQQFVSDFYALINKQKMQEALILTLDQFQKTNDVEVLNFSLELFSTLRTSLDIVTQLVEAGATFKDSALLELVLLKRKQQIIMYTSLGLDFKYVNDDGFNALHIAIIRKADIELIQFLHEQGVELSRDKRGYTPIDYLVKNDDGSGYAQTVKNYFDSLGIDSY